MTTFRVDYIIEGADVAPIESDRLMLRVAEMIDDDSTESIDIPLHDIHGNVVAVAHLNN